MMYVRLMMPEAFEQGMQEMKPDLLLLRCHAARGGWTVCTEKAPRK